MVGVPARLLLRGGEDNPYKKGHQRAKPTNLKTYRRPFKPEEKAPIALATSTSSIRTSEIPSPKKPERGRQSQDRQSQDRQSQGRQSQDRQSQGRQSQGRQSQGYQAQGYQAPERSARGRTTSPKFSKHSPSKDSVPHERKMGEQRGRSATRAFQDTSTPSYSRSVRSVSPVASSDNLYRKPTPGPRGRSVPPSQRSKEAKKATRWSAKRKNAAKQRDSSAPAYRPRKG